MSIGETLKKTREEKGLSYKDIQNELKIRTKYLQALEEENFTVIPGEAYVRAFLKSYARLLGLNAEEILQEYEGLKKESEEEEILVAEKKKNISSSKKSKRLSLIIIGVIILVLAFLIFNIMLLNNSRGPIQEIIGSNFEEMDAGEEESLNSNEIVAPSEIKETASAPLTEQEDAQDKTVKLKVVERSWLQVKVDGEEVFEGILEKGEERIYTGEESIFLKIGNAAGVIIEKDGQISEPLGERGEVIIKEINF